MKKLSLILTFFMVFTAKTFAQTPNSDWLISAIAQKSEIKIGDKYLELNNGLMARRIHIAPNAATTSFKNLTTGEQLIRSVRPEGISILQMKGYVFMP